MPFKRELPAPGFRVLKKLVKIIRENHLKKERPSLGIIDAKSVKNADTAKEKGYDGGKKISGIKLRIVTDTLGLPHAFLVTPAAGKYIENIFPFFGVRFIAINDHCDSLHRNPESDGIILFFRNILNEWYSKDCSKKVRSAYRAKAIKGELTGPVAPYGYRKDPADKRHLILNECAPVIRRMFRLALEGKTCCIIAAIPHRDKVLTPQAYAMVHDGQYFSEERKNNPYAWSLISVKALLSNPVYLGKIVSQRATSRSYKDKRVVFRPKDEWITVENTHEALVDKVTFDTVQERLKIKKPDWMYNPNSIFRGLLFCGERGRRRVFSSWACAKGGVTGKFSCAKYRRYGGNECSAHSVGLSDLKTLVLEDIRRHASLAADRERYVDYLVSLSSREWDGERASWTKEAERCRKRLDELDAIIRKLYEDSVFGRVSEERYATLSASYEEELKKLKDRYTELQDRIASYGKQSKSSGEFAELVARYTDITELTEELLNTLVKKNHDVLLEILSRDIHDNRMLRLIFNMLKAGYWEDWKFNQTISGCPQGGVISPLLANIYLNEFDQWMEKVIIPENTRGKRQKGNPAYSRMNAQIDKAKKSGDKRKVHKLEVQRRSIPSVEPYDKNYRRCRYVRYADDFIIGFTGSKAEAEAIKARMGDFLRRELKLELSEEKTLITNAGSQAARFLNYDIKAQRSDDYVDPTGRRGPTE